MPRPSKEGTDTDIRESVPDWDTLLANEAPASAPDDLLPNDLAISVANVEDEVANPGSPSQPTPLTKPLSAWRTPPGLMPRERWRATSAIWMLRPGKR